MKKFFVHIMGMDNRRAKYAIVSAQKAHTGRSSAEKMPKNSTAPPSAPNTTKPRSCPSAPRRRKRNTAVPAKRQYRLSSSPVRQGRRRRKGRSRSYSSPAHRPSRMDWPNTSSWLETWFPMVYPNRRLKKPPRPAPSSS